MRKYYVIIIFLLLCMDAFPQLSIRGSMGIQFQSTPSLNDYLNTIDEVGDFSSTVIFAGEAAYPVTLNTELGLEIAYQINSYTFSLPGQQYELKYGILMPSVIYSYVIRGTGYNFKFGGGAGVRFASVDEKNISIDFVNYSSTGVGFLLRAEGNTLLTRSLFANIGGEIRYDINGEPKDNGTPIRNDIFDENLNLNSFSVGIRIGLSYQF